VARQDPAGSCASGHSGAKREQQLEGHKRVGERTAVPTPWPWCQPGGKSPLTASSTATRHPLGSGDRARVSLRKPPWAWTLPQQFTSSRHSGATSPGTCHLSEMSLTLLPTFSFFSALAACLQMGCHTSEPATQQKESV